MTQAREPPYPPCTEYAVTFLEIIIDDPFTVQTEERKGYGVTQQGKRVSSQYMHYLQRHIMVNSSRNRALLSLELGLKTRDITKNTMKSILGLDN